ncbi:putative esterase/hydrolase [Acaromyces ingoldii]|uniref:Putative esterase/hydrolase n=1 Tax=Acaromyces ingoldii TaxID=215250 RepID=A0A316YKP8_9BASI|nr:putative esterase/hydrolase [Acaromyces ingoldii]PWN89772.1 putative esterase/hydrolase [Acaromyces ingoldii]
MASGNEVAEGHVTSRDGTRIGFQRRGSGPGLVLVQGAMATAYNFNDLAEALAPSFTVYTPDRRGRGMSAKPYDKGHEIARDVEDLDALLAETGASRVFGLSSGAMITLEAARTLPRVTRASVYEPPFYAKGISHDGIRQLNAEIEEGRLASALVSALLVAETAPAPLQVLPRPVLRLLASGALLADDRRHGPYARLRDLLPGVRYDFNVVGGMDGKKDTLASIDKPVLLISGTRSPAFLQQSIRTLASILPQAQRVELEGLDHSGSWNASRGGHPQVVAAALRDFFA